MVRTLSVVKIKVLTKDIIQPVSIIAGKTLGHQASTMTNTFNVT